MRTFRLGAISENITRKSLASIEKITKETIENKASEVEIGKAAETDIDRIDTFIKKRADEIKRKELVDKVAKVFSSTNVPEVVVSKALSDLEYILKLRVDVDKASETELVQYAENYPKKLIEYYGMWNTPKAN
jgi:hypothetical protein